MSSSSRERNNLVVVSALFAAAAVSLVLLIFVARAEAVRIHTEQVQARIAAQAKTLLPDLAHFIKSGLPLRQYAGFTKAAQPLVHSDDALAGLALHDANGRPISAAGQRPLPLAPRAEGQAVAGATARFDTLQFHRDSGAGADQVWQVAIPLHGRFSLRGYLVATVESGAVVGVVRHMTYLGLGLAIAASAAFAVLGASAARWRGWLLTGLFVVFATAVIASLAALYASNAQARADAAAEALAARLSPLVDYNLRLSDVRGLDTLLQEVGAADPTLSRLAITRGDQVRITARESFDDGDGPTWDAPRSSHALAVPIGDTAGTLAVRAALPYRVVYDRVVNHLADFVTVLTACAFVAASLFGLARAAEVQGQPRAASARASLQSRDVALWRAQPVLFLAVTAEHLSYSFLPPLLERTAVGSFGEALTPLLMAAYFGGFALALVPGGQAAARRDPRQVAACGAVLAGVGLLSMLAAPAFWPVLAGRIAAGVGQGLLLASFQVYLLDAAGPTRRTYAASIIVFAFNAGMIAGTALGGLAVRTVEQDGVFLSAAVLAGLTALGIGTLLPAASEPTAPGTPARADEGESGVRKATRVAANADVLKALLLIGWPAKAALTGVVVFALPLLLDGQALNPDRIGQAVVIYALAVLAVSKLIARRVDRTGRTRAVLSGGAMVSAVGIGLLAPFAGEADLPATAVLPLAMGGVLMLGIGHGCVNAPVVAYVAGSRIANVYGHATTTSTYRLLERGGHVIGPIAIGGALQTAGVVGLAGWAALTAVAAGVFALTSAAPRDRREATA